MYIDIDQHMICNMQIHVHLILLESTPPEIICHSLNFHGTNIWMAHEICPCATINKRGLTPSHPPVNFSVNYFVI